MIDKVSKKTYHDSTSIAGIVVAVFGAMDITGMDLSWIIDSIKDDPKNSLITLGLWFLLYSSGKSPRGD